jgi:hypothetical protein
LGGKFYCISTYWNYILIISRKTIPDSFITSDINRM